MADPLRRVNTEDNTPASITVRIVSGDRCAITVVPKGFGWPADGGGNFSGGYGPHGGTSSSKAILLILPQDEGVFNKKERPPPNGL